MCLYNSRPSGTIPRQTQWQIAAIMCIKKSEVVVHHQEVQLQRGSADCGLFAAVFATTLCAGEDPTKITYVQHELRSHLVSCLERHQMSPFPRRLRPRKKCNPISEEDIIPVFCVCRLPKSGKMIACDTCQELMLFHDNYVEGPKKRRQKWQCCHCTYIINFFAKPNCLHLLHYILSGGTT